MALLTLLVRWLHVLAMAFLVGGALAVWWVLRVASSEAVGNRLAIAASYERLFWLGMGIIVATGIGNLGAMAPAIPTTGQWARTFAVKLVLVAALLVLSLGRSIGLYRLQSNPGSKYRIRPIRYSYAATTLVLVGILTLAEVIAHG